MPRKSLSRTQWTLIAALVMIVVGALLACTVQTVGGDVRVRDIRFVGTNGIVMSALLYVPKGASKERPAPGVVAIHGYINSRETQSPYAIELARRGYVVLALDQTGHGYSDPPAFANGYGGPDGLRYLKTLDFVDQSQVVLEGHSMGGWAVLIASKTFPDAYRSIVVSGSSTGTFGAPEGDEKFPRNFGLVFSRYDEFSDLMWGAKISRDIVGTAKLQKVFGTSEPVQVGRLYGSIEQGTARMLYMPAVTHPGDHITSTGVAPVIDWVQQTTKAPKEIAPTNQIWQWKEFGTLLTLIGLLLFIFPFGSLLLDTPFFGKLRTAPAEPKNMSGPGWWFAAALVVLIPTLSYFALMLGTPKLIKTSALFPQEITTGIMGWALANALLSLVLFVLWHYTSAKKRGAMPMSYGLTWRDEGAGGPKFWRSVLLAAAIVGTVYLLLAIIAWIFQTDARFWVYALKPMSALQLRIFLSYLIPIALFFVMLGVILHGQLRRSGKDLRHAMIQNAILLGLGFALLLIIQYAPLFAGATLAIPQAHLYTILAIQFVIWLPVVALISTYFFYKTGRVYVGALVSAFLLTWMIVATQATHHAFA
jgi:pimeloyl-ACP methyl ester carboxylesterase